MQTSFSEAFQRPASAKEYAGTGIRACDRAAHRAPAWGRIWAEAEVGKGAVFFFTLAISGKNCPMPGWSRKKPNG